MHSILSPDTYSILTPYWLLILIVYWYSTLTPDTYSILTPDIYSILTPSILTPDTCSILTLNAVYPTEFNIDDIDFIPFGREDSILEDEEEVDDDTIGPFDIKPPIRFYGMSQTQLFVSALMAV